MNNERYDEASDILHFVADVNKVTLPEKMNFEEVRSLGFNIPPIFLAVYVVHALNIIRT